MSINHSEILDLIREYGQHFSANFAMHLEMKGVITPANADYGKPQTAIPEKIVVEGYIYQGKASSQSVAGGDTQSSSLLMALLYAENLTKDTIMQAIYLVQGKSRYTIRYEMPCLNQGRTLCHLLTLTPVHLTN